MVAPSSPGAPKELVGALQAAGVEGPRALAASRGVRREGLVPGDATLVAQLAEGGRVQPIGPSGAEMVTAFLKRGGQPVEERELTLAHFVPPRGRHGVRRETRSRRHPRRSVESGGR